MEAGKSMRMMAKAAAAAAVATGGMAAGQMILVRRLRGPGAAGRRGRPAWLVATVDRAEHEVAPDGRLPEPLARLGDAIEVQVRPAPGDRGTELWVRPRAGADSAGADAWARTRLALRQAKTIAETGEVLQPDRPGTARSTLLNRPIEYAVRQAREVGRL